MQMPEPATRSLRAGSTDSRQSFADPGRGCPSLGDAVGHADA
jgi:hypothetical protein